MRQVGLYALVLMLITGLATAADTVVQQKVLSADNEHWNISTRAAVAGNGTVLAYWTERNNQTNAVSIIKGVLCTRSTNGSFNFSAPKNLSSGSTFDDNAWIVWHAPTSSWFAVWYHNPGGDVICSPMEIHARRFDADGTPVGSAITVIDDGTKNVAPVLCAITAGPHNGRFLLCWVQRDLDGGHHSSLRSAIIDIDGAIHSGPFVLRERPLMTGNTYHPGIFNDLAMNTDGSFLVAYSARRDEGGVIDANLLSLGVNGGLRTSYPFVGSGDRLDVRIERLKANSFVVNWRQLNVSDWGAWTRKFNGLAAPVGKTKDHFPTRRELYIDTVKLGADKGMVAVSISSGLWYSRYLKKNGAPKGPETLIASAAGAADEMRAYGIPGTNQIFVIWRNRLSNVATDVRALVFTGKE